MKVTYSQQFGRYHWTQGTIFDSAPRQISGSLEVQMPKSRHRRVPQILLGFYADKGSLLPGTAGITLTLNWGK